MQPVFSGSLRTYPFALGHFVICIQCVVLGIFARVSSPVVCAVYTVWQSTIWDLSQVPEAEEPTP